MNIFRLTGDLCHVASFLFLIHRLWSKRNSTGISLKTQEMYLLVFLTRYVDLFTNFHSLYNTVMKVLYIAASGGIVYLMRKVDPWSTSYESNVDTFLHVKFGLAPCAILALIFNEGNWGHWHGISHYLFELLWAFSIYLEAIAILPQLIMLQRHGGVENLTANYMATLGAYRAFYILNWVYRWWTEPGYSSWIAWIAGVVQTLLVGDFLYIYIRAKMAGRKHVILPVN